MQFSTLQFQLSETKQHLEELLKKLENECHEKHGEVGLAVDPGHILDPWV
jgi:hypothetical protein